MYQYQYYTHDPQSEQYGPPCSLCGGFNHSPKHCYKGEHDINNIMEKMSINPHQSERAIYISIGDHDNPHEPPQIESEGCDISQNTLYSHQINLAKESNDSEKLFYIYQHFQDSEKIHHIEPERDPLTIDNDSLYLYVNNDIKYGLFEDLVESYYLDSQIKDDFQCDQDCYVQHREPTNVNHPNICTHDYQHITQNIQDLTDNTRQNNLHSMEECTASFTDDTNTHCDYSISDHTSDTESVNETHTNFMPKYPTIHSQRKHTYRDTFGDTHIQYHDFDDQDLLTFQDKYTALLQQELQNPYWNLHDPIATKSYQISKDMDIETMPHAMYFTGHPNTVTKINQVSYQMIEYNDNGMFTVKPMTPLLRYLLITAPLHPYCHCAHITNSLFYTHTPKSKVILPYIQEEV